jgi:hypothetical protein
MVQARSQAVCGCFIASRQHGRCCRRLARSRACRRGNQEHSGDLRLCIATRSGITTDGRYVVVIREVVQCVLLNLKTQSNKALEGKASQNLAYMLGICSLATERWPGATHAQATCEVRHICQMQRCVSCAQTWRARRRTCSRHAQSSLPCRRRRIVSRLRSRVSNKTLSARAALAKPWRLKSRSCAGSLKPQLVASQECNVAEGCNAMSQQNLEEEAGCGQTDCRKMKKQAMAKRTADKEAGNDQATRLQKKPLRFCCRRRTHTTLWSSPLATLHSCEATS